MELKISGNVAKQLLVLTKKDGKLALALAQEWIERVDSPSMNAYLFSKNIAVQLLADRLSSHPDETLKALQRLPESAAVKPGKRRGRPPGSGKKMARRGRPPMSAKKNDDGDRDNTQGKRRKRKRLDGKAITSLKSTICSYLKKNPWSNRGTIYAAASIPSTALYNRLMGELKSSGEVIARGERAKAVYAVKGTSANA